VNGSVVDNKRERHKEDEERMSSKEGNLRSKEGGEG
jgi:hypothetical protein